jgi:hypothetical protein
VLAGVADQRPRQALELSRPKLLPRKPGCDHDSLGVHGFAVLENQTEPVADIFDSNHPAGVEIGNGLALEPLAVPHELLERLLLLDHLEPVLVGKGIERNLRCRSAMWVALQDDCSFIPFGMLSRQNDIGTPNTRVAISAALRCAATARP